MRKKTEDKPDNSAVSSQVRGETMAYAMQSGIFSIMANLYEPYLNLLIQKKYYQKYAAHDAEKYQRYGTYTQNLAGELVGDLTGAGTLFAAELSAPEQLHRFTRGARRFIDPLFESVAHRVFYDEKNTPGYEQKMEEWKVFQERNFVRSGIIASAGMAGNLLTQKLWCHNPSPTHVIFLGKAATTMLTTALGLGVRFAFPDQMKGLDGWVSKRYLAPRLNDTEMGDSPKPSFAEKVTAQNTGVSQPMAHY
jgi:hypothetical protein